MAYIKSRKHAVARALPPHALTTAATATLMAIAAPALAQTSGGTLGEVKVEATSEYKTDAVSSPKYTAPLLDTPQTITVIPQRVLEQQNRQTLVEALSTVPGITFGAGEGGGGYGDSINFRGYSANNNITIDGLRDSAQYNRTDSFNLEQIEITNGANSVYGGAGNVSGGINLVSKTPKNENFFKLSGGLGTDSYGRLTVDFNRKLSDTTAIRLNTMVHNNDVPGRDVEKYKRWGVAPSITFGINSPTKLTLSYVHQKDENIPQYGVPYFMNAYNNGPLPGVKSSNYYGYSNFDTQDITTDLFTAAFEHKFSESLSVKNITRVGRVTQFSRVSPPQGTWCLANGLNPSTGVFGCAPTNSYTVGGPRGNTRDTVNDIIVNQTDFTSNFKTGAVEHTLVTGFSLSREEYTLLSGNSLRNAGGALPNPTFPAMSISDPNNVWTGPINFIPNARTVGEQSNAAVYVFDNLKFNEQWSVNAGLRYEHISGSSQSSTITTPVLGGVETWGARFNNSDNLLSYRLGLVYKPATNASIYAAYGNSKTPSKANVNGACTATSCNVDPETAVNYEIGTKWDVLENRLSLTAAYFRNKLTNYKVNSNDPTMPDQQLDGASQVDGIALGASGQITPAWGVFANYTYLKSKVIQGVSDYCIANPLATGCPAALAGNNGVPGNPLTNTPENSFSVWTTYAFAPGWTVGYGASYQGSWYLNNGAGVLYKAPGYLVHNAMVAYRVNKSFDVQFNLKNLTDKVYYTRIRNNGWAVPGDGRALTVTANYSF